MFVVALGLDVAFFLVSEGLGGGAGPSNSWLQPLHRKGLSSSGVLVPTRLQEMYEQVVFMTFCLIE